VAGDVRYYTLEDAARMLRLSPERVRQMLEDGELEGTKTGDTGGWRVPMREDPRPGPPPVRTPTAPPTEPASEPAPEAPAENRGGADSEPTELPVARAETAEPLEASGEPGPPPAELEEARQPAEPPRGEDAAVSPEPTSKSGWVTTQQAARALGISARTVRWHIDRGNLDAKPEGEGVERTWRVSVDSLQAFRDSRQRRGQSPRDYRVPATDAEIAAEDPGSAVRALADRLVEEARRAEAARVRLELAERAQSTLEAELAEERRRREDAERERREAQTERDAARRELEALERGREEPRREDAPPTPPSAGPSDTPPAAREAPQTGVEPLPEEGAATAAAVAGPLRPPGAPQDPSPGVPAPPARGRRGLLRRFLRG
jgi:translation initiation factor IF-2